jgi:hypothetical protein
MGTRADFYVGRGEQADWLGSVAWDGYPDGIFGSKFPEYLPAVPLGETQWRKDVAEFLANREDASLPKQGWPWPWEDSQTTDYAYALDDGAVWGSCFGHDWFLVSAGEPEEDEAAPYNPAKTAVFPNMKDRQNVTLGARSGVIVVGPEGII